MPPEPLLSRETDWAIWENVLATLTPAAGPAREAQANRAIPFQMVPGSGVAVVSIQGVMEKRGSAFGSLFGESSMLAVKAGLNAAVDDELVKSILLRIDSPGGSVSGTTELADHVAETARRKRTVTFVDGLAASAAFWAGAQASEIWASRDSLVGSIGVFGVMFDTSEMAKKEGVKPIVMTTGKFKAVGVPGTKITDEQIAEWQKRIDFSFAEFKAAVGRGRGMSAEAVDAVADGRVFHPPEALANKLIDRVMSFEDAVALMVDDERVAQRGRNARAQASTHRRKI